MIPTLSQVCTLNAQFEDDVVDYAAGHCDALEVWLTKLEEYLKVHSLAEVQQLFQQHGITPQVASFQGGLLTSQGDARAQAWDLLRRRLDLCRQLQIETLVVVGDIMSPLQQQDLQRVRVSLQQLAEEAQKHAVRVAFEFQGRAVFGNNLQTAAAMVQEVGSPYLGLCLDAFQFYIGPSKYTDLGYLTRENLFHVQLCDLADVPREFASDSDRILPGDGDLLLQPIVDHLKQIDYDRCVSIELMNPQIWQVPPRQFGEIAMTALRKLLGQARMD